MISTPQSKFDIFVREHESELNALVSKFADYEPCRVNRAKIESWLAQFDAAHFQLAIKLMQHINYFGITDINGLMPNMHALVMQHIEQEGLILADAVFVPFGDAGESGQGILTRYRNACGARLQPKQLCQALALPAKLIEMEHPIVIFLDDFIGTGTQVSRAWDVYSQLIPVSVPCYLFVIGAFEEGVNQIETTIPSLKVIQLHSFGVHHQLQESSNRAFSPREKRIISGYCERAGNLPLGFGDVGAIISFAYSTPNNTLSLIRGSKGQKKWQGLLPRWDDL